MTSRGRERRAVLPAKTVVDLQISLVGRAHIGFEIYNQLLEAIRQGRVEPGSRLPPTRELARRLKVARTTVAHAYERLAGEGLLTSRTGGGTFVNVQPESQYGKREAATSYLSPRPQWAAVPIQYIRRLWSDRVDFDFRTGIPDVSAFPHDVWRRLITRHMQPARTHFGYGDPAGHPALRAAIARHVWLARGIATDPETVTITNGTQQAIDLVSRVLLEPGDRVAVEDPGYPPAWLLFKTFGARVEAVRVDTEGLMVEALPADTRLVYVTPSHQFPLGMSMSLPRRQALLDWARRTNAAIIEDDYDSEFRFGDRPIEPLRVLDHSGSVIYVGSFSKTALPSLRIGFVIAPPAVTEAIRAAKYVSDWMGVWAIQASLADFINEGWYARYIRRMRTEYARRHDAVIGGVQRHLHEFLEVVPSAVGLHVCALTKGLSASDVHDILKQCPDVRVDELAHYSLGTPLVGLLFGYGAIAADRIDQGIKRLRHSFIAGRTH